jgi:hypothetical protein
MPFLAQPILWLIVDTQIKVDRLCKLDAQYQQPVWMLCEQQPKDSKYWDLHRMMSDLLQYLKVLILQMYQLQLCPLESMM